MINVKMVKCKSGYKEKEGKCVKKKDLFSSSNKKSKKIRNRIITLIIAFVSGYILIINNSLDFLIKFGISVNQNIVAFIGFLITLSWAIWKAQTGEL